MSVPDWKRELRDVEGVSRVAELADGLSTVDGSETTLLLRGGPREKTRARDSRLEVVEAEFDDADYVLASVEGTILLLEGTVESFDVSYLPEFFGGVGSDDVPKIVDGLFRGTLEREPLDVDNFLEDESDDAVELIDHALDANLTRYATPREVARLAANWGAGGDCTSVLDVACGSGELLTAAIDAAGDPDNVWGVDASGLAAAVTETRVRERDPPSCQIRPEDFFSVLEELSDRQQTLSAVTDTPTPARDFDCVVAHPPIGQSSQSGEVSGVLDGGSFRRTEHEFVRGACRLLSDSGRGCFLLPSSSVRRLREHVLPEGVTVRALVALPEGPFSTVGVEPILVLVKRASDESDITVMSVSSFDHFEEICGAIRNPSVADNVDNAEAVSVCSDLPTTTIRTLLAAPGAAPFFTGDLPTLEDVTERIATGTITGSNPDFYFDEKERAESGISDQFFTPVIESKPETNPVTEAQIDLYLFDLREFVSENEIDPNDIDTVVESLMSTDRKAATYVDETLREEARQSNRGVLPRSIPLSNPDLVTGAITSDVEWHRVDLDAEDVLYDTQVIGVRCKDNPDVEAVQTLLNTPLYRRLNATRLPNLDANYVRVQTTPLRDLPVLVDQLSGVTLEKLDDFEPFESREPSETARTVVLEGVDPSHRGAVSAAYDAIFPPSTLAGYETEIGRLKEALDSETEIGEALDLVDDEMLEQLETTFASIDLLRPREPLVSEILTVYTEGRYWAFMTGVVSQLDGILEDYVEQTGGEVDERETECGTTRLEYRYRDDDWKPLRLKLLLDQFFSGDLLQVMHKVRRKRNDIAHGRHERLFEDRHLDADIVLLSFFVFTGLVLSEYIDYLGAGKSGQ